MKTTNHSEISAQNDKKGREHQSYVARYLEKKTGEIAIVQYDEGIDIIIANYKVEVKGTTFITTKKEGNVNYTNRGWKAQQISFLKQLTHFAFVLEEDRMFNQPRIFFVDIIHVIQKFNFYFKSGYVSFRLGWVLDHLDRELSFIE